MIQIDRLRVMASEAILEYQAALMAGSEPSYPQWADDLLVVCECAEAALPIHRSAAGRRVNQADYACAPA